MNRFIGATLAPLFALALLSGCSSHDESPAARATFTAIAPLPGHVASSAVAVSADGSVVAGISVDTGVRRQALRWDAAIGSTAVGVLPGGTWSAARGISADGSTIVGDADAPGVGLQAFRATPGAGIAALMRPPNASLCSAAAASRDGSTIVGTCLTVNDEAFRWTGSQPPASLGQLGPGSLRSSVALAIDPEGATIVGAGPPVVVGAAAWTGGEARVLGILPGDSDAAATAVAANGAVIVGRSGSGAQVQHAFRWTATGGLLALADATGRLQGSIATGVSGDGRVIVGVATVENGERAFVWDAAHGMRLLADALRIDDGLTVGGWRLLHANAISADGRTIVGDAVDPAGLARGFVVRADDGFVAR